MSEHALDQLAAAHRAGRTPGVTSVCSAHPTVLDETVRLGAEGDHLVLIEATCNQVNQDGGYTGMRPADFRREVERMAEQHGLSDDRLVLGGDHLGPEPLEASAGRDGDGQGGGARRRVRARRLHQDAPRHLDPLRRRPAGRVGPCARG